MSKIVNKINLTKEEVAYLESILRQATSEARVYVRAKILLLKHKGYTSESAVINAANGTARMINKICSRSLMVGASHGQNIIDAETVRIAVEDNQLG